MKKEKVSPDLKTLHKLVKKIYPTDFDKTQMILTMLGEAARMSLFLNQVSDFIALPEDIKLSMAITANNMIAMQSEGRAEVKSFPHDAEAFTYREKLIIVVKHLYESLKAEGAI